MFVQLCNSLFLLRCLHVNTQNYLLQLRRLSYHWPRPHVRSVFIHDLLVTLEEFPNFHSYQQPTSSTCRRLKVHARLSAPEVRDRILSKTSQQHFGGSEEKAKFLLMKNLYENKFIDYFIYPGWSQVKVLENIGQDVSNISVDLVLSSLPFYNLSETDNCLETHLMGFGSFFLSHLFYKQANHSKLEFRISADYCGVF